VGSGVSEVQAAFVTTLATLIGGMRMRSGGPRKL